MMIDLTLLLAKGASFKKYKSGDIIFREGESCYYYHQLTEGKVCWSNFNDDGREILHEIIAAGECFGELPLFDYEVYACTAVALTDVTVLRLTVAAFEQLLNERPEISRAFNVLLTKKLRFKMFLVKEYARRAPEDTIEAVLGYLQSHSDKVCGDCCKLLLTRQQVANMTGLRVETVIRATKSLEARGLLKISKGKVFLNHQERSCCGNRKG